MRISSELAPFGVVQRVVLKMVGPTAFTVYALLTTYANNDNKCFPSIKTLAAETGVSESTIQRALKALEAKGIIAVERRVRPDGSNYPNLYTIKVVRPEEGVANLTPRGSTSDRITIPKNNNTYRPTRTTKGQSDWNYDSNTWIDENTQVIVRTRKVPLADIENGLEPTLVPDPEFEQQCAAFKEFEERLAAIPSTSDRAQTASALQELDDGTASVPTTQPLPTPDLRDDTLPDNPFLQNSQQQAEGEVVVVDVERDSAFFCGVAA